MNQLTDEQMWHELCAAARAFEGKRYTFFKYVQNKVDILRKALHGGEVRVALEYLKWTADDELKKALLRELVKLASVAHNNVLLAREVIVGIEDKEWVVRTIEEIASDILSAGDDEEYLRLGALYASLDEELLQRHLERCRHHPNPHIRKVPTYFDEED
jgi:hypothetical protein